MDGTSDTYHQGDTNKPGAQWKLKESVNKGMTTEDQRMLLELQASLRANRRLLVDGTYCDIERDDGSVTRQHVPGLLRQLVSAIGNSNEQRRWARTRRGMPIVISVQAFDIMASIERVTRLWTTDVGIAVRINRTVTALGRESIDAIPRMRVISHCLEAWVRTITELFDPPRRLHLAAPCPECGKAIATRIEDGEKVTLPALQISRSPNGHQCQCVSCGACWQDTHFLLLARVLGCESIV